MFQQNFPRRYSFGSIPSSKYTENDFTCNRLNCHCESANLEADDSISSRSVSSRRHAEYFYRPPILSIHREQLISNGSPYSYFEYDHNPNAEAEYCEQCQFCSVGAKWCGRYPSNDQTVVKMPRSFLDSTPSDYEGLYGLPELKVQLPHATWVQDPFVVNAAQVVNGGAVPREQEQQFQPAVFSHSIGQPSGAKMDRNPSIDEVLYASHQNPSMDSLQQMRTINQVPAKESTYLKSCRDVRTTQEERCAIEEGSLVISIPPSFTNLSQQLIAPDEFELRLGEAFVVCRMYADMWALCARIRNSECIAELDQDELQNSPNLKFIPLCAVTLASNYAAFTRRCTIYRQQHPHSALFPTGGHLITPPDRVESLEASRRYFSRCDRSLIPLPPMVQHLCKAPVKLSPGFDYVPMTEESEAQENIQDEAPAPTHQGTLSRFWKKWSSKDTSSPAEQRQTEAQVHTGLTPDGKSSYPRHTKQEISDGEDGQEVQDTEHGNGNKIGKRKSVRNFFSRSVRVKNGDVVQV
ncbi:hypothetical protein TSTA_046590 [Talaromyces stipitatus ATCC 10500]|uniref:Uncharacterized protein n=1 Tax=Talaromyces stipitatus (strain ATCC 10500 / CBS 375.48 / QM 6759 / NRRL 1006) TaxID=441959 RepID=B8MJK5_TALSN|nr:uncharacterized protein TSTA_046590 [Talaromyces stipitatus ATCC 10500]EED15205.1 hypothetical protein TSTA_046590 [Talaromyces stipitatus ATCC 10500]